VFFFKDKENIYHPLKTYLYDGLDILSDGTSSFLNGAGIDAPLQVDDKSYLQDHLGSASQLLDAVTGNSKARYDYKSYGTLEGNPPALKTPLTYTGREDDQTGLLYYRARYYDPEAEIFISQDPLGDAQRYVGGNPLSFTDPLGLEPFNSGYCPLGVVYDTGGNPTCLPILPFFDTGALVRGFLSTCGITATESADSAILPKGNFKNVTDPGSTVRNLETDLSPQQFIQSIEKLGFKRDTVGAGKGINYSRIDGARYFLRNTPGKYDNKRTVEFFNQQNIKQFKIRFNP
jgi:RHS repeat-associated protein